MILNVLKNRVFIKKRLFLIMRNHSYHSHNNISGINVKANQMANACLCNDHKQKRLCIYCYNVWWVKKRHLGLKHVSQMKYRWFVLGRCLIDRDLEKRCFTEIANESSIMFMAHTVYLFCSGKQYNDGKYVKHLQVTYLTENCIPYCIIVISQPYMTIWTRGAFSNLSETVFQGLTPPNAMIWYNNYIGPQNPKQIY